MHGSIPLLLLAMIGGYWVLTLAQDQPKPLGPLGRFVGLFTLLVSMIGIVCVVACGICCWKTCHKPMSCPVSAQPASTFPQP